MATTAVSSPMPGPTSNARRRLSSLRNEAAAWRASSPFGFSGSPSTRASGNAVPTATAMARAPPSCIRPAPARSAAAPAQQHRTWQFARAADYQNVTSSLFVGICRQLG
jgi:hypothetical protein